MRPGSSIEEHPFHWSMLVRIQPGTAYTVRQTVCFMFGLTVSLCPFWAPAIHRSLDEQSRDGPTSPCEVAKDGPGHGRWDRVYIAE